MIYFDELSNASTIYETKNINKLIVLLSADTLADCAMYRILSEKYPDLDNKFITATKGKNFKPADYIRVQLDSGQVLFFIIIRLIGKFQPYLFDIIRGLDRVMSVITREVSPDGINQSNVLFPLQSFEEMKLCDGIVIPAIADKLFLYKDSNIFILDNGEHEQYIDKITEDGVYYKQDSWKSDWMLSVDDILLLDIMQTVMTLCHDWRISKTNLVRCYYICNQFGMFPKLEFYDTEFGKFFRMFLPKSNSLINHGLLMNHHHYFTGEQKKFACSIGPMFPHLWNIAYTIFIKNKSRNLEIAEAIRKDYFELMKANKAAKLSQTESPQQTNKPFTF